MPSVDASRSPAQPLAPLPPTVAGHLLFTLASALVLMLMYSALRLALLHHNSELIADVSRGDLFEAFFNGLRFDLRVVVYAVAPLLLSLLSPRAMAARNAHVVWLTLVASLTLLLGVVEMDFYREFHQRLNSLVFQYLEEDLATVSSMLWHGFPVGRYLLAWALATLALGMLFHWLEGATRPRRAKPALAWYWRLGVFFLCLLLAVICARGTLKQGPPLRWGDAFTTDSMFANHLGLNGVLTLVDAAENSFSSHRDNAWKATMPDAEALAVVRQMLLGEQDVLVDEDSAAIRRDSTPLAAGTLPIKHVVVILMESFAGRWVGALGSDAGITPNFDRLSREGLLFTRFFSNGTHTHQGMFATMACFPNLPSFEYLMRTPEGSHQFSGLPQQLGARGYDDLYVYNGNFQWDNQSGFFSNQGMRNFIGREDFVDPVFIDPTWGVSDQDMFDRAAVELNKLDPAKPFYALLQTLSNHTPYALPEQLPMPPVTDRGSLNQHLTAMRYSDWALGQFFDKAKQAPYYKDTLFVIVGDHGFGSPEQLTEMDLFRHNVPLLLLAPGIQDKFGARRDTVGTQIDVVPTIMARLGGKTRQQCWGRDLLGLPEGDQGIGVIKPSGSDQTVAIVSGEKILVQPKDLPAKLYRYDLGARKAQVVQGDAQQPELQKRLEAFLQVATQSLLRNTAGVTDAAGKDSR
ncbi:MULTISPECIES: LTA synthase family protein [unclassified Pseudomonas]|uniref:LTA synthase family protein n=1 Tax=unclassified Pseudomonas TaxID=196821 RepID=UPI00244BF02D|nr:MULTISPECIES: LTA synthase family protein [unclassified Pseudomonas]MDG9924722.1 LTA synthase family protein [Pseudomonas sp. GD04045]MDH0036703.1 LTA synthase family protein [Pseudomonas sp. GD04019]